MPEHPINRPENGSRISNRSLTLRLLVIVVVSALAPQPVKQVGLYPLVTAQTTVQTGLWDPIGLAGSDQAAGVSVR